MGLGLWVLGDPNWIMKRGEWKWNPTSVNLKSDVNDASFALHLKSYSMVFGDELFASIYHNVKGIVGLHQTQMKIK